MTKQCSEGIADEEELKLPSTSIPIGKTNVKEGRKRSNKKILSDLVNSTSTSASDLEKFRENEKYILQ
jgi:hypothetical protein